MSSLQFIAPLYSSTEIMKNRSLNKKMLNRAFNRINCGVNIIVGEQIVWKQYSIGKSSDFLNTAWVIVENQTIKSNWNWCWFSFKLENVPYYAWSETRTSPLRPTSLQPIRCENENWTWLQNDKRLYYLSALWRRQYSLISSVIWQRTFLRHSCYSRRGRYADL